MLHQFVRYPQATGRHHNPVLGQQLEHRTAKPTGHPVLFHRQHRTAPGRQGQQFGRVQGADKARVDHRSGNALVRKLLGGFQGRVGQGSDGHDQHVLAIAQQLGLANGNCLDVGIQGNAEATAPRKAHRRRSGIANRRGQKVLEFVLVLGRHHQGIGKVSKIRNVEQPLVGGPIAAHQPSPIQGKGHVQVLKADIVHHLIVGALEERRIDCGNGLHALAGQARRKGHGVLLGDADVVEALGKLALKTVEPGSGRHGGGNGHDAIVLPGQTNQSIGEDSRVGGRRRLGRGELAGIHIETRHPMVFERVGLGGRIPVPLLGQRMDQHRTTALGHHLLGVLEGLQQDFHPVPLNRAHVTKVQGLKEQSGGKENLERLLGLPGPVEHVPGQAAQELLCPALHAAHHGGRHLAREVRGHGAHVR